VTPAPRLRVAVVLPAYFPGELDYVGGGDRYAYRVADALRSHCEVTFVTFGPRLVERSIDGLRHVVVPALGRNPDNPVPSPGFFLRERFDVIHVYQLRSTVTSMLAILAHARRTPLVVTDVGGGGRSLMYRLQLHRYVRRFVLISDFSRQLLPESTWNRAAVVKGGIDLARFPHHPGPRRRQVVQVGRIMPHKGINFLIDAAGSDIPVVVAGRVVDQAYYQLLVEMSKEKQVTFITDADDTRVRELYENSAVTVAASVYQDLWGRPWPNSELLGLTLLESMATGTPVVCTAVGGMPEYVVDGTTGCIVPPGDPAALRGAILKLLDDPALAAEMGLAGNRHVQQFAWANVAAGVAAQYALLTRAAR